MKSISCPLCYSTSTQIVDSIDVSEIKFQYVRTFGVKANIDGDVILSVVCHDCGLGFFDPMAAGDESLYEQLQRFDWYYMTDKSEYAIAKKYIPGAELCLEVGAGKAAFSGVVGKSRYVGLEFNDEAIIRAKDSGVTLLKESIENHAAGNAERYAAVVSFQVLEHIPAPADFIRGCVKALQKGGFLILGVPNHDGVCGLAQNHLLDMPPHHVTFWSEKTLANLAPLFGLELQAIEVETLAEYHRTWALKSAWEVRLRRYCGIRPRLLDTSFVSRAVSRVAAILSKIVPLSINDLKGHSIVAVYRKV